MSSVFLLGRLLFGGYFLYNGINHFRNHESLTQYAAAKDVPNSDAAVKERAPSCCGRREHSPRFEAEARRSGSYDVPGRCLP